MRLRSLAGVLFLCLLSAENATAQSNGNLAGIQSPDQLALDEVDGRLVSRFPASVAIRIGTLIDSVRREGLPAEPLILRALEGGAKRVPADRIHAALLRLGDGMRRARQSLGYQVSPNDLATAGAALQAGVTPAGLLELRALRGDDSLTVPLGAYLDLAARGAAPGRAWERVMSLARANAADSDYGRIDPTNLIARQEGDRR